MKNVSFLMIVCLVSLLYSCKKDEASNCAAIQQVKIVVDKDSFLVGDQIKLKINQQPTTAYYNWVHGNNINSISNTESVTIDYADKKDEGWYYLNVSNPNCASHDDSVYISVRNKPATAPCTSTNNTVTFSSIPDISPATVTWAYDNSWNRRTITAKGGYGYPSFNIYFNTFWDTKEPEDGEYTITGMGETDEYPVYTVYLSSIYSSVFFDAGSGKVYVSHVNGKLRVTFCSIPMSGSLGGPSFTTTATGMLTAP